MAARQQATTGLARIARRALIQRTARIWTRLTKAFLKSAKAKLTPWLEQVMTVSLSNIERSKKQSIPDMPKSYLQELRVLMLHGLVYGYWLSHLHVQDVRQAYGHKHSGDAELRTKLEQLLKGRIKLAEADTGDKNKSKAKSKNKTKGKNTGKAKEQGKQFESVIDPEGLEEWNAIIPETAIEWLDGYIPVLAGVLQEDVQHKVQEVVLAGMKEGLTVKDRMNLLKAASPVLQAMTEHRLETIARTELTRADTIGRLIEYTQCEDVDGVEFNAILDTRTTEICRERNGLVMRLDDKRLAENTPPLHPNCRSMLLATTIYEHKGKLKTSSEFDEVPESMQRDIDVQAVQIAIGQLPFGKTPVSEKTSETFSAERKQAGTFPETPQKADELYRKNTASAWKNATQAQKESAYDYTSGDFYGFNAACAGYNGGPLRKNYVGPGKVDIDHDGYGDSIRNLTTLLENAPRTEHDIWVKRTSNGEDLVGMLNLFEQVPEKKLAGMSDEFLQSLVGREYVSYGFTSTSAAKTSNYANNTVDYEIFVPKGTEALYMEPFSAQGGDYKDDMHGLTWNGKAKQVTFGNESEMLLQRGLHYKISGISRDSSNKISIELEVHPELGYEKNTTA